MPRKKTFRGHPAYKKANNAALRCYLQLNEAGDRIEYFKRMPQGPSSLSEEERKIWRRKEELPNTDAINAAFGNLVLQIMEEDYGVSLMQAMEEHGVSFTSQT